MVPALGNCFVEKNKTLFCHKKKKKKKKGIFDVFRPKAILHSSHKQGVFKLCASSLHYL